MLGKRSLGDISAAAEKSASEIAEPYMQKSQDLEQLKKQKKAAEKRLQK